MTKRDEGCDNVGAPQDAHGNIVWIKPSEISLHGAMPLAGTMGVVEIEEAAAMIVRVCQALNDKWQAVTADDVNMVFRDDIDNQREPFCLWMRNPFFRPNFPALRLSGYARVTNDLTKATELTEAGIGRLGRYIVKFERRELKS